MSRAEIAGKYFPCKHNDAILDVRQGRADCAAALVERDREIAERLRQEALAKHTSYLDWQERFTAVAKEVEDGK